MHYEDDETILNDDYLLRRVMVDPVHVVEDKNQNRRRPSSATFEDHPNGSPMSVTIEKDLFDQNESYERVLMNQPNHLIFALAKFKAGLAREKNQIVAREPVESEPAHGVVVGHKSRKVRSGFAKASEWAIAPFDEYTQG